MWIWSAVLQLKLQVIGYRHIRCVVATLGGSQGVGAQYGNWKSLHAGVTVWVNQTSATGICPIRI